jgi:hypothetical protein
VKRLFFFLVLVVGLSVLWVARAPLLTSMGGLVVEDTPLARADIVIVLANTPGIAAEAAAIVKGGYAPRVLLFASARAADDDVLVKLGLDLVTPHDVVIKVLRASGVAPARIVRLPLAPDGTNQAAREIIRYAHRERIARVIAVTERAHTRRTARLLRRELTAPGAVIVRASPRDAFRPESWWRDRASARELAMEGLRWLNSFVLRDLWAGKDDAGRLLRRPRTLEVRPRALPPGGPRPGSSAPTRSRGPAPGRG